MIDELTDVAGGHFGGDASVLAPTGMGIELFETKDRVRIGKDRVHHLT
jgi:hypothetical protein